MLLLLLLLHELLLLLLQTSPPLSLTSLHLRCKVALQGGKAEGETETPASPLIQFATYGSLILSISKSSFLSYISKTYVSIK